MTCESCTSLTARLQQAEQERDEARADAGELAAITAVVSDQGEVGTYGKVEALVIAKEGAEQQVAALQRAHQHCAADLAERDRAYIAAVDRAEAAERQALALREYVQHKPDCVQGKPSGLTRAYTDCTCGLSSLLTDRSEEKK